MGFDTGRGLAQDASSRGGAMVDSTASHQAMVLTKRRRDRCTKPVISDLIQGFALIAEHAEEELWLGLRHSEAFSRQHYLWTTLQSKVTVVRARGMRLRQSRSEAIWSILCRQDLA